MLTTAERLSWKSPSLTFIFLGSSRKLDQDTSQSHTQRGQRRWRHLHRGGATMFSVCPWPARSWLGPALDTPPAKRAPGWCDGAESISTRLLEPPLAVIVITHPGPVSQPTIYAICTQMWNYEAASHKRDRLSWLRHHRDYDDGFTHHTIVSENWRWFPEETKWPSTVWDLLCCLAELPVSWRQQQQPGCSISNNNTHSNLHLLQSNSTVEICLSIVHIVNAHRTI